MHPPILFLRRKDIDIEKWNAAIEKSLQCSIYATSYWLDVASPGWSALATYDYSIVMPLPVKKKWGLRYLTQPAFTQQLGIYTAVQPDADTLLQFYQFVLRKYAYIAMAVHYPPPPHLTQSIRKNHVLLLNKAYPLLYAKYSKSLQKNIKKAQQCGLVYKEGSDVEKVMDIFKKEYSNKVKLPAAQYGILQSLVNVFLVHNHCFTAIVCTAENETVGVGLFFLFGKKIYQLMAAATPKGKKMEAHRFMIDNIIKKYAQQDITLDFEGSCIPGVERFNIQFGAATTYYYTFRYNNLPWPLRLFKPQAVAANAAPPPYPADV